MRDVSELVARLRLKGQQDREMPNHYVRRMSLERAEAADAIEAQAREIAALTARAEAAEVKYAAIEARLAVRRKMHRVNAVLQSCAMIRARLAGPTPFDAMTISDLEELYTDAATRAEAAEAKVARLVGALKEARDEAHSVAHSEFDGVWSQEDFDGLTPLADAALAEIGGGNG